MLLRTTRRTRIVWAAFAGAMTLAAGLLMLGDGGRPRGLVAAGQGRLADGESRITFAPEVPGAGHAAATFDDPIRPRDAALDRERWKAVVVHHSGAPAGDVETLTRQHLRAGLAGLGYHFVIGNGHGLGDGVVVVGPRWSRQLAGAHVSGPRGEWFNEHAIGICLVGNGDRHPFTERQMRELVALVRRLQGSLEIPASAVQLHADVAPVASPGALFPASVLEAQLLR